MVLPVKASPIATAHWIGRCAAVARKQRRMQIDAAQPRQREHPGRNQAPVGNDDDRVGSNGFKPCAKLQIVANLFRLRDLKAGSQRGLLDRRSGKLAAVGPPAGQAA